MLKTVSVESQMCSSKGKLILLVNFCYENDKYKMTLGEYLKSIIPT